MLDREIPFEKLPAKDIPVYEEAEKKERKSWQDTGCVRIIPPEEAERLWNTIPRNRLIRCRFYIGIRMHH